MKFSIIIPVYNVEKYLKKCLTSIVQQNFNDYELILVDDGSTDIVRRAQAVYGRDIRQKTLRRQPEQPRRASRRQA